MSGRYLTIAAAVVLSVATTAQANDPKPASSPAADAAAEAAYVENTSAIVDDVARYTQWLIDADRHIAPVRDNFQRISAIFGSATPTTTTSSMIARINPVLAEGRQLAATARHSIETATPPDISRLPVPPEYEPVAIQRGLLSTLDGYETAYGGLDQMLGGLRTRNVTAINAGNRALFRGARMSYEAQLLVLGGQRSVNGNSASDNAVLDLELTFHRLGIRAIAAAERVLDGQTDPTLTRDVEATVATLDQNIAALQAAIQSEKAGRDERLAVARSEDHVRLVEALLESETLNGELLGTWRAFRNDLSQAAGGLPLTLRDLEDINPISQLVGPYRNRLDAIFTRQAQLIANLR